MYRGREPGERVPLVQAREKQAGAEGASRLGSCYLKLTLLLRVCLQRSGLNPTWEETSL